MIVLRNSVSLRVIFVHLVSDYSEVVSKPDGRGICSESSGSTARAHRTFSQLINMQINSFESHKMVAEKDKVMIPWYCHSASPMLKFLYTNIQSPNRFLLPSLHSLLDGLHGAYRLLDRALERLVGYDDIVELVL